LREQLVEKDHFPFQRIFERDWKEKNLEELMADGRLKLTTKYQRDTVIRH